MGDTIQVCVVTKNFRSTILGLIEMGIGPWAIYTFGPGTVTERTYMGIEEDYSMRLALATSGNMMWEVIEPLEGKSIYKDFLAAHGEGIHHVGMKCQGLSFDERVAEFEARGCRKIQSGVWLNSVPYAYFETEGLITTTVEIFEFPENFVLPEPEEWLPARPSDLTPV